MYVLSKLFILSNGQEILRDKLGRVGQLILLECERGQLEAVSLQETDLLHSLSSYSEWNKFGNS
jgi:hypothetical protein